MVVGQLGIAGTHHSFESSIQTVIQGSKFESIPTCLLIAAEQAEAGEGWPIPIRE